MRPQCPGHDRLRVNRTKGIKRIRVLVSRAEGGRLGPGEAHTRCGLKKLMRPQLVGDAIPVLVVLRIWVGRGPFGKPDNQGITQA
jgi:hypothetical protein